MRQTGRAIVLATVLACSAGCDDDERRPAAAPPTPAPAGTRAVSLEGVSLRVPRRWYDRSQRRHATREERDLVWLQVSTIPEVPDGPPGEDAIVVTLLEVGFGRRDPGVRAIDAVNRILATATVRPRR